MTEQEYFKRAAELFGSGLHTELLLLLEEVQKQYGKTKDYWFFFGVTAFAEQRYLEALHALTEAERLKPGDIRVHFNLGIICSKLEQYADAMGWFKKVLAVQPEHIPTLIMVSAVFDVTGNPTAGEKTCRLILKIDPKNVSALNNLGNSCKNSGKPQEAAEAYRTAISLNPSVDSIRSNLLFSLNYSAVDPILLKREHQQLAAVWDKPKYSHAAVESIDRKIRIGFVSPDFCTHSVAYFLKGLYTRLDRSKFFLASYGNVEHPDELTDWFEKQSDLWRYTEFMSKEQIAEHIYTDKIDILIDLAGHTGGSNLAAFGLKPAPVQISWLGYPATTGMKSIQYRITDPIADPDGFEQNYTEELIRLPHFLNYTHRENLPDCNFQSFKDRDYVLFGSFNNIAKLSAETIALWASALEAVPGSKLLIKHKYFNDPGIQSLFLERFKNGGIDPERLIFHSFNFTDTGHLEEYHQIDIALDSWPYNGTTTTFEAMVMGVPTLTMSGNVHASRVGTAIMSGVGLTEFTADSPEEFAQKARELTQNRENLLLLKEGLRERFYRSPFADSAAFTRSFEDAVISVWRSYCEKHR